MEFNTNLRDQCAFIGLLVFMGPLQIPKLFYVKLMILSGSRPTASKPT